MVQELVVLGWSVALLFVHIVIQGTLATSKTGLAYNVSARDSGIHGNGLYAGRAYRALWNFLETFPAFIALVLALTISNRNTEMTALLAWVWLGARVFYLPLYLFGIPYLRTLVWAVSFTALVMLLTRFMGWV